MILAAGLGTRLWPLTEDRTKPAVPFLGKPLVQYAVEYARQAGIRDVVVNLHHRPESVRDVLGDGHRFGARIEYSFEPEILGTGGALDKVRDLLAGDDFVVLNGKIVTDIDLRAAIDTHRSRGAIATLVLKPNARREHFTIVHLDDQGDIARFEGFPDDPSHHGLPGAPLMFTGIQVLSPRIFDFIPRGCFSHTTTSAFPAAIRAGERVAAHVADGEWRELSTLERYLGESLAVMRTRGLAVVAGEGSHIEDGAEVERAVLWNGVVVARGATVRDAVLGDGVRIGSGERIEGAVVVRAEHVDRVERGEVRGDNLVVPLGPVLDSPAS
jgi:NDP-sugar pyrophosphorylase family protein